MTNTTAILEDEILALYEYPKGHRYYHESCDVSKAMHPASEKRNWPIAVASGALNTSRFLSNYLAQELASHGFTVISIDHPYDTDIVEFPNGDVITGGHVQKPVNGSTASVEFALEVRAQDASFVLDRLGVRQDESAVMFGNSFGGAAAATALFNDKRFRAGVNIDGMMFGPVLNTSLGEPGRPQAFMLWGSAEHHTLDNTTWNQFWTALTQAPYVDYKKEFSITNSSHASYWDLGVLADLAGVRSNLSETAKLLVGPPPSKRNWGDIPGRYIAAFFKFVLGLEAEDEVLKGPSGEYPEVNLLRGS
ncbi:hypothetical protein DM02DRAFT_615477 [Periconia macrospinosa]|uniref:1-alkyl-2-acetylglycerophosphocholine esterase n=1 Tax=Periconia macrospinosa TaxID=97972 RepID=A0A2V1DLH4_9PLEO|nr:hypothetical protein DM02DRAFT_615477 [Periconia macrospinosa]